MILSGCKMAVKALKNFVSKVPNTTIHSFKGLQSILDWDYFKGPIEYMTGSHPTFGGFQAAVAKAAKEMWYHWHIFHPAMPFDSVHEARSMSSVQCQVVHYTFCSLRASRGS